MLLSNNAASVELFGEAAIFTDNSVFDIRRWLESLRQGRAQIQVAAEHRRGELTERWDTSARALSAQIAGGVADR